MSVSLTAGAKHGQVIQAAAFSAIPWAAQPAAEQQDGFELSGVVVHVAADRQIYAETDEARLFYKVVSGVVRSCRFLNDGHRQIDAFHRAGAVFGLEAGASHQMTAEAVSDCTLIAYRRRGIEVMIARNEALGRWFFGHAMRTLALTREHLLLLGRASAAQKISTFLLEVADRQDSPSVIELPMSRQDIADYLGLTIETVSRTFSHLERDNIISLPTARKVVLQNQPALRSLQA